MSWIARLGNLFGSNRHGRDLDRELDFHIAEKADELVASGMPRPEAERQARIRFGHRQGLKEQTREAGILIWVDTLWTDLRYAVRGLRASPGFTSTVVLSLALGIGANTAIFSLLNAVLLKSLPVSEPEQLMQITLGNEEATNPIWEAVRREQDVFDGTFAFVFVSFNLADGGEARRVEGNYVGGDYFQTLGVAPASGRLFTGADDYRGCPAIAVLGNGFWRSEYGADGSVIGKSLSINGHPFEIVGVTAAGFFGTEVGRSVKVYVPLCSEAVIQGKNSILDEHAYWAFSMMGRPKPGRSLAEVNSRLAALSPGIFAATVPADWDGENAKQYLAMVLAAHPATTGLSNIRMTYKPALLLLMVVVGTVLLIACANVANLLLARGTVRTREIAMRLALGAGRGRLIRQMLTESLLLALLGAVSGFLFARWGSQLLVRMLSGGSDGIYLDLTPDGRLLGFTILVAVITAILFGVIPAWRATHVDPQIAMRSHGRGVLSGGSGRFTLGKALVLGQVALSLVLVLGAALMLSTFHNLAHLDPGFRREGLLAVGMDLRSTGYSDARRLEIQHQALDHLRTLPGVRDAASTEIMPISGMGWNGRIVIAGRPAATERGQDVSFFNRVSTRYFSTMGTRLIAGRDFSDADLPGSAGVAIINETMAARFYPGVNPVGQTFQTESGPNGLQTLQVIGVVQDAKYRSLREDPTALVYVTDKQSTEPAFSLTYLLQTDGDPAALIPSVRAGMAAIDKRASFNAFPFERQLDGSLVRERMLASLSSFFAGLALLLALVGIYGIMAYSVARRRNEIGIRLALGAERSGVLRLVLTEVGRLVLPGVILGVIAAVAAGRLVTTFLYGVSPTDLPTLLVTAGIVIVVALGAGAVPASRAARLDPVAALRED